MSTSRDRGQIEINPNEIRKIRILGAGQYGSVSLCLYGGKDTEIKSLCDTHGYLVVKEFKGKVDENEVSVINHLRRERQREIEDKVDKKINSNKSASQSAAKKTPHISADAMESLRDEITKAVNNHAKYPRGVVAALIERTKEGMLVSEQTVVLSEMVVHSYKKTLPVSSDMENFFDKFIANGKNTAIFGENLFTILNKVNMNLVLAVNHLHQKGIVHSDIAARNLLVGAPVYSGGKLSFFQLKITDFGMSIIMPESGEVYRPGSKPMRWCSKDTLANNRYTFDSDLYQTRITLLETMTRAIQKPIADVIHLPKNKIYLDGVVIEGEIQTDGSIIAAGKTYRDPGPMLFIGDQGFAASILPGGDVEITAADAKYVGNAREDGSFEFANGAVGVFKECVYENDVLKTNGYILDTQHNNIHFGIAKAYGSESDNEALTIFVRNLKYQVNTLSHTDARKPQLVTLINYYEKFITQMPVLNTALIINSDPTQKLAAKNLGIQLSNQDLSQYMKINADVVKLNPALIGQNNNTSSAATPLPTQADEPKRVGSRTSSPYGNMPKSEAKATAAPVGRKRSTTMSNANGHGDEATLAPPKLPHHRARINRAPTTTFDQAQERQFTTRASAQTPATVSDAENISDEKIKLKK